MQTPAEHFGPLAHGAPAPQWQVPPEQLSASAGLQAAQIAPEVPH